MSIFSTRPALRWLVPAAVAVAVVGGGAAAQTISASAEPSLPERSAAQLLVDLQTARLDGLSGTVRTNAELGLPALPQGQGSADLTALVSGSRTLRVWYAGTDKARVALLGTLGETDVIRNGNDVWIWDSRTQQATHHTLSAAAPDQAAPATPQGAVPRTPQEAADLALRAIDPTTVVSTGNNARVAGRSAYELILAPRDTASLIGEVRLAVDAEQHVPLRVQLLAKGGGKPAYEVAFTQVAFKRPADAQFAFNPPPGTKVEEARPDEARGPQSPDTPADASTRPRVVGTGWTSVLVAKMPAADPASADAAGPQGLLDQLPRVSGDWGSGRLITGRLFTVLLTDDGRVLAGAVAPERLYEAARG